MKAEGKRLENGERVYKTAKLLLSPVVEGEALATLMEPYLRNL